MLNMLLGLTLALLATMAFDVASVKAEAVLESGQNEVMIGSNPDDALSSLLGKAGLSVEGSGLDATTKTHRNGRAEPKFTESTDARAPWGRTFFARSEALDITQPISVTQVVRLAKGLPEGSLMRLSSSHPLGTWLQTIDENFRNFVTINSESDIEWLAVVPDSDQLVQTTLTFRLTGGSLRAGDQFEIDYSNLLFPPLDLEAFELPVEFNPPSSNRWHALDSETRLLKAGSPVRLLIEVMENHEDGQRASVLIQPVDALGFATTSNVSSFDLLKNNGLVMQVRKTDDQYIASDIPIEQLMLTQFSARSPGGGLRGSLTHGSTGAESSTRVIWSDFSSASLEALGVIEGSPPQISSVAEHPDPIDVEALMKDLIKAANLTLAQLAWMPPDLIGEDLLHQENDPEKLRGALIPIEERKDLMPSGFKDQNQTDEQNRVVDASLNQSQEPFTSVMTEERTRVTDGEDSSLEVNLENALLPAKSADADRKVDGPQLAKADSTGVRSEVMKKQSPPADIYYQREVRPLRVGGQTLRLTQNHKALVIAQPELTSDRRSVRPALVEQLSGPGGHAWLVDHFAVLGDAFGVIASRRSFNTRPRIKGPETAIVLLEDQTLFEALERGQTYITTGHRAYLDFRVNDTAWGRSNDRTVREISVSVISHIPPLWARIYKNGMRLTEQNFLSRLASNPEEISVAGLTDMDPADSESGALYLLLESSARPLSPGTTLPRNGREWLGLLALNGLRLKSASAPQMLQVAGTKLQARLRAAQVDFLAWTQGQSALIRVNLERDLPAAADTNVEDLPNADAENSVSAVAAVQSVQLKIAEGFEDLSFIDPSRPPAPTPIFSETFDLEELRNQQAERRLWVDGYQDRISLWYEPNDDLKPEPSDRPSEYSLLYSDAFDTFPGDYYTIEVLLEDGTQLFGSPIFVGGFAQNRSGPSSEIEVTSAHLPTAPSIEYDAAGQKPNSSTESNEEENI